MGFFNTGKAGLESRLFLLPSRPVLSGPNATRMVMGIRAGKADGHDFNILIWFRSSEADRLGFFSGS